MIDLYLTLSSGSSQKPSSSVSSTDPTGDSFPSSHGKCKAEGVLAQATSAWRTDGNMRQSLTEQDGLQVSKTLKSLTLDCARTLQMLGLTYGAGSTAAAPGAQAEERNSMRLCDLTGLPYMRKLPINSGVTSF